MIPPLPKAFDGAVKIACTLMCALVVSCGGEAFRPGSSDKPRQAPQAPRATAAREAATWEGYATLGSLPVIVDQFASRGHQLGALVGELRANDDARNALATLVAGRSLPQGAVLVQVHRQAATGAAGPIFVMQKRESGFFPEGGDWEYVVATAEGKVEQRGKLAGCARCHADAAADFVFQRVR